MMIFFGSAILLISIIGKHLFVETKLVFTMLTVLTTDHDSIVNINAIIACVSTIQSSPSILISDDKVFSLHMRQEISKVGPIFVVVITIDTITYNLAPAGANSKFTANCKRFGRH